MLDRDEIESRTEDGFDPLVVREVRLQVQQHLVGNAGPGVLS